MRGRAHMLCLILLASTLSPVLAGDVVTTAGSGTAAVSGGTAGAGSSVSIRHKRHSKRSYWHDLRNNVNTRITNKQLNN